MRCFHIVFKIHIASNLKKSILFYTYTKKYNETFWLFHNLLFYISKAHVSYINIKKLKVKYLISKKYNNK